MHLLFSETEKNFGIGLTGGIGVGKSAIAQMIRNNGYQVFDADTLAKEILNTDPTVLRSLKKELGQEIFTSTGELDRKKLGFLVVENAQARKSLESILHPKIQALLETKLQEYKLLGKQKFWFYEASLLFETGRYKNFKEVWLVDCPLEIQVERVVKRNNWTRELALKWISTQWPREEKIKHAHKVIDSSKPIEEVEREVRTHLKCLK